MKYIYNILTLIIILSPFALNAQKIDLTSHKEPEKDFLTPKNHDVKFIIESSLSMSSWDSGVSKIVGSNQNLLDYDTEGLKLYSVKGKVNIFDTDVFGIEKYGTFEKGKEQKELLKLREYSKGSAIEGLNLSLRAFLIYKYFYLYSYDFLDDIEYQYDYYNFYAKVKNNIDVVYWWGVTNKGNFDVKLQKGHVSEFTTEFNEHRVYLLDFKRYFKRFFIDSLRVGLFRTYWVKESFVGITIENGTVPIIQHVLLESDGISLQAEYFIDKINLDLKFRYNYGIESYVVVSNGYYNANYNSFDLLADYRYDIYENSKYSIFTKVNASYSGKWFDNYEYNLNNETVLSMAISLGIMF